MEPNIPKAADPKTENMIMRIGLFTECLLLALAVLINYYFGHRFDFSFKLSHLFLAGILTIPLLAFNYILFFAVPKRLLPPSFEFFLEQIIKPLCLNLPLRKAAMLTILAGAAEELFFRGAIDATLALFTGPLGRLVLGSFIFAYLHFAGRARQSRALIVVYFCMGAYFWCSVYYLGSLIPAMLTHAVYDFIAIAYIRWHYQRKCYD